MLDLAEEALRLRAENEKLREEREEDQGVIRVWRGRTARAEAEVEKLRAVRDAAEHVRLYGERNIAYSMPGLIATLDSAKEKP